MTWDATTVGAPARDVWVLRRDGSEDGTFSLLPSVLHRDLYAAAIVDALNKVDARLAAADEEPYRKAGWQSRAQHDTDWAEALDRCRRQPDLVRNALNDRWKADGYADPARQPLTVDDYLTWLDVMDVICEKEPAT